jgi:hypothetical protein
LSAEAKIGDKGKQIGETFEYEVRMQLNGADLQIDRKRHDNGAL